MKKKACRRCKLMVDAEECPLCKTSQFAINWKGRIYILNQKSDIAKKTGMTALGEYAIKVN